MKNAANFITLSRIFLSLVLLSVKPLGAAFIAIYLLCGASDIADGYIARRTGTVTGLGARLDSAADLVMTAALFYILFPVLRPGVPVILWVAAIALVRAASFAVVIFRYKTFAFLHTRANKLTGFALLVFPLSLALFQPDIPIFIVCLLASVSSVEELLIHLSSRELSPDRKSIFEK